MNVLVLQGGSSNERDVSLRSGAAVVHALHNLGHTTLVYDPADGLDGIIELLPRTDLVFPALHGAGGEDGTVQTFLESYNIRYVGANSAVSKLCFDKVATKQALEAAGIATPKWQEVTAASFISAPLAQHPYVLKPRFGGSSLDVIVARSGAAANIDMSIFERYDSLVLEELIEGIELTVGVVGEEALPVVEIIPPEGEEFSYDNKYNGATQELCPPQHIDAIMQEQAQDIAELAHGTLGVRHLSRTDMIMTPRGHLYTLEINTMPGLTDQSLLPKAAAGAGMSMDQLIDQLINLALQ